MCDHMEMEVTGTATQTYWDADLYCSKEIYTCRCAACDSVFVLDEESDIV